MKNRRFGRRWDRCGAARGPCCASSKNIETQHRHQHAYLLDEVLHVGGVGLGQLGATAGHVRVVERHAADVTRQLNQARLEVAYMGAGEILIFRGDEHDVAGPERFRDALLVLREAFAHRVGLADVRNVLARVALAEQDVHARPRR
ncbi:hypothetical protein JT358_13305 [Micrococcales bacterium 31B]|nr:hypothetical protein [Micrococcales bacterium 31B]